jgi:hypothetical protein
VIELSTYVFEVLRKDNEFILYRGRSEDDAPQVLVLSPATERPPPQSQKRLEHEYSLREVLDPRWAARPMAMASHGGPYSPCLGGPRWDAPRSIDRRLGRRLAVPLI